MFFKDILVLLLKTKVALALEGLMFASLRDLLGNIYFVKAKLANKSRVDKNNLLS